MPQKIDSKFFAEVKRLRKKFPKLTQAQAYKLANENLNPKRVTIKLDKKSVVKPTGKLIPKGKLKPQGVMHQDRLVTKSTPAKEVVIVKEEKKGINIYFIIVAAAAAYYFLFKKKR